MEKIIIAIVLSLLVLGVGYLIWYEVTLDKVVVSEKIKVLDTKYIESSVEFYTEYNLILKIVETKTRHIPAKYITIMKVLNRDYTMEINDKKLYYKALENKEFYLNLKKCSRNGEFIEYRYNGME